MPGNPLPLKFDVAQLVQNIREQSAQRGEGSTSPGVPDSGEQSGQSILSQLTGNLRSISNELDALELQSRVGEPTPPGPPPLRARFGSLLKTRLTRFLWWHGHLIRTLAALVARQNHEQVNVIEALSARVAELPQVKAIEALSVRVAELQQYVSRLEFAKSNRSELVSLSSDYDSILAAKPDRSELSDLAAKLKALETERVKELPALIERVEQLSGSVGQIEELSVSVERLKAIGTSKAEQQDVQALAARIKELSDVSEQLKTDGAAKAEQLDLKAVDEKVLMAAQQITALRRDLQDFHRRLGVFLEQAKLRMPEPFSAEQLKEMAVKGRDFGDSLYLAFEDHFRGSFDAVRDGLKVYLPYVREAVQRTEGAPVLDVACGRGEWLDLLREERIQACGVDLNGAAIELCRQRGLEAAQEDAFAYLRKQQKNGFSAVTSFHFIEHLDYRSWITLIDEALRVLKPGGIAVFETPNARNILTTSGDFYRDPTHTRPVFPETIEVIAELRGFFDSKVYCFDENRSALSLLSQRRFDTLQDYVSVSRDAAWVGIKS